MISTAPPYSLTHAHTSTHEHNCSLACLVNACKCKRSARRCTECIQNVAAVVQDKCIYKQRPARLARNQAECAQVEPATCDSSTASYECLITRNRAPEAAAP
jgi:hypothetical protein